MIIPVIIRHVSQRTHKSMDGAQAEGERKIQKSGTLKQVKQMRC